MQKKIRQKFRTVTIFALFQFKLDFHLNHDERLILPIERFLNIFVWKKNNCTKIFIELERKIIFFSVFFFKLLFKFHFRLKWSKYFWFLYRIFTLLTRKIERKKIAFFRHNKCLNGKKRSFYVCSRDEKKKRHRLLNGQMKTSVIIIMS